MTSKVLKMILTTVVLGVVSTLSWSCSSPSASTSGVGNQVVAVQRGNLTIDITGAGNLALSLTKDLAFEIAGTVEEVVVEEGDTVEKGQVLARLDTPAWEEQLKALKNALTAAERNLSVKQRAVPTAERNLAAKERVVVTKELALRQAQISLQTAEYNLSQITDVKKAQDAIDAAEYDIKIAQTMWEKAISSEVSTAEVNYWRDRITSAKASLAEAQKELKEILAGSSVKVTTNVAIEVATKKLQVEQAQRQVEDAQIAIEDARIAVEDARIAVEDAKTAVEDAKTAVEDAKTALDEAKSLSPVIKAPFAGFVTKVNVKGGDEVKKGTVAMQVADPAKFTAEIIVNEMDISRVKLGGSATVQVSAMPTFPLTAKVTQIAPTATIQSGVVNYKVKVEVQSLEAVMSERQPGGITQEQAEEMMKQRQQRQAGQQRQTATTMSQDFQLREGLTVTVSIIVEQKSDVLLVPNAAITTKGRQAYVQVLTPGGTTEERAIQAGISNWQYTEVTSGLSEGEKVVVPKTTTTTTTTQQKPGGMMPIPPGMLRK